MRRVGWLRIGLAALAWSGLWPLAVMVWPTLWSGSREPRPELRGNLGVRADGQFVLDQRLYNLAGGGMGWSGPHRADLQRRPLPATMMVHELAGWLPAPGASLAERDRWRYLSGDYGERRADSWQSQWLPGRQRPARVVALPLDERSRESDGSESGPPSKGLPAERWRLVGSADGRRFHLEGWRHEAGSSAAVVWFDRRGFAVTPPAAGDWFAGAGHLSAACLAVRPDERLRPGLERPQAWPQPVSWLICADGGLLSVDPITRRARALLPPCGVSAVVCEQPADRVLLPPIEPRRQGSLVAALAGEQLILIERPSDRVRRYRLPAELRGRASRFLVLGDGSIAASPDTDRHIVSNRTMGRLRGAEPLVGLRFAASGQVLTRVTAPADTEPAQVPTSRLLLCATCPLLPAWRQLAHYSHDGVRDGLALAPRVHLAVALALAWRTGSLGWALTGLLFGLPGLLAWLSHGDCRPRSRRCAPWQPSTPPGRGAMARLVAKEWAELSGGWLVGLVLVVWCATRWWGSSDTARYMDRPAACVPCLSLFTCALAAWLATAQQRRELWPWLLSRPAERQRLLAAKTLAGLSLTLSAALLGALARTLWALLPGYTSGPVTWPMLRPVWLVWTVAGSAYLLLSSLQWRRALLPATALLLASVALVTGGGGGWAQPQPSPLLDTNDEPQSGRLASPWPADRLLLADTGDLAMRTLAKPEPPSGPVGRLVNLTGDRRVGTVRQVTWLHLPAKPPALPTPPRTRRAVVIGLERVVGERGWYVVCRPPDLRRYHLVAYNPWLRRRAAWYSRAGFTTTAPPPADDFDVADGGMYGQMHLPGYGLVVADRGRLLRVVNERLPVEVVAEAPRLRTFAPWPTQSTFGVREADRLHLPADYVSREPLLATIPAELRERDFWAAHHGGRLLLSLVDPGQPLVVGVDVVMAAADGRVLAHHQVSAAEVRRRAEAVWRRNEGAVSCWPD